jgi:PAS domain S-box-containing protein
MKSKAWVIKWLSLYMLAFAALLAISLYFSGVDNWYYALPAIPVYLTALSLSNEKQYKLARNIVLIGSFLLFTFWAFTHRRIGGEYALVAVVCSIPMVYNNTRKMVLALVIVLTTLAAYLLIDRLTPFKPNPTINYRILSTSVLIVAGGNVLVQIILYRNTLIRYMKALKEKNKELDLTLSDKNNAEAALLKKNEELSGLTNQLNLMVERKTMELKTYVDAIDINIYSALIDLRGRFAKINQPFLDALGYSAHELIGKNFKEVECSLNNNTDLHKSLSKGSTWRNEIFYRTKFGTQLWCDLVIFPVKNKFHRIEYFLTLGLPITERKQNEEMRNQMLRVLKRITFQTSHEIRGPIARIQGLTSLVQEGMIHPEEVKLISEMLASCAGELNLATTELVSYINNHENSFN